jgi:hypothetical protein
MSIDPDTAPRYFAMELAEGFLSAMHPDGDAELRERIIGTIMCAGQHLADRGHPGAWSLFDAASFLPKVPAASEWDLLGICLDLAGLFGWMTFEGFIAPARSAEILTELRAAGPRHSLLGDLCDSTAAMFRELSAAAPS